MLTLATAAASTLIFSPLLQRSPLEELVLELDGALEPGELTQARGVSVDYRLQLPPAGWRQLRPRPLPRGSRCPTARGSSPTGVPVSSRT